MSDQPEEEVESEVEPTTDPVVDESMTAEANALVDDDSPTADFIDQFNGSVARGDEV